MRPSLLKILCCPACGHRLSLAAGSEGEELWEGTLHCDGCGSDYRIDRGLPHVYVDDERWAPKAREAQGWIDFHKQRGIYEQPPDAVDLKIPYYPEEPWLTVARSFDIALEELASVLVPGTRVLDLGAGRGWAAKHFALHGCDAVALDIAPDENVGLGRSLALMQHAGVRFDPVIGDGERLPFLPESFDLVFCAAALHHTSDLPLFMRNIYRALRPGGRLCAIGEPCISIADSARHVLARDARSELEHGINEQRPNLLQYWSALKQASFANVKLIWPPGYALSAAELRNCAMDLGGLWPDWSGGGLQHNLSRFGRYIYYHGRSARSRRAVRALPALADERQLYMRAVLLFASGELAFVAQK